MPSRILIGGYYGHGNAGDEALLAAMLRELRARRPGLEITVASGDPERTRAEHGVGAVAAADLPALAGAVRKSDLVIVGGGGLFQDYWDVPAESFLTARQGGIYSYLIYPVLAALLGRPSMVYAVGVGPLNTEEGKRLTRVAFELSRAATVRDDRSLALLEEIGVTGAVLSADPAFLLDPAPAAEAEALLGDLGIGGGEILTGVSLRHWDFGTEAGVWEAEVARGLNLHLKASPGRLLFLPFQSEEGRYEDDLAVARRVAGALRDRSRAVVVDRRLRPEELAALLSRCRRVLAMRFHSALFALAAGVPTAALAYDPKVTALMEDAGLSELALPVQRWRAEDVAAALRGADREDLRERLASFAGRKRELARGSAELALQALDGGDPARSEARRFLDETALAKAWSVVRLEAEREDLRGLLAVGTSELAMTRQRLEASESELTGSRLQLEASESELAGSRLRLEASEAAFQAHEAAIQAQQANLHAKEARLRAQRAELKVQRAEMRVREAELEESRRLLTERERELEGLRHGWQERGRKLDEAWAALAGMRDQRDMMLRERNELARRLGELEATVAYRAVSRFWGLMRQTFPEGSRRRALYKGGRTVMARLLGVQPGIPGYLKPVDEETPAAGEPDPRGDLLRFEERVQAGGAGTVVVIFSATQLLESEGQRPTQLALELARRGLPVVFCYWRWWPNEWCAQDRLEEGIVQIPIDVALARPEMLAGVFSGLSSRIALFEFPYPGFFEILAALNAEGWVTVYDVLDDWEEFHRVGQAVWYDEPFERHLIAATDAVFAINDFLAGRIRELGGNGIGIVGNGLKPGLEVVREERPLDRGEVTVGYFGYLAGAWFDWELIAEAARRRPSWRFYLIGYGGSPEGVELPENVALLGKKPQGELAAFAANWDVAVIPFKPDRLAAGADPIKTYEYLAMGLPVVAAGVYPPSGGEAFVTRAEGVEAFLEALARAAAEGKAAAPARRAFAASCTWAARLDALLGAVARGEQRVAEKRALSGWTERTGEGPLPLQVPDPGRRRDRAARPPRPARPLGDRGARLVLPRPRRPFGVRRPGGPDLRGAARRLPAPRARRPVRRAGLDRHRGDPGGVAERRRSEAGLRVPFAVRREPGVPAAPGAPEAGGRARPLRSPAAGRPGPAGSGRRGPRRAQPPARGLHRPSRAVPGAAPPARGGLDRPPRRAQELAGFRGPGRRAAPQGQPRRAVDRRPARRRGHGRRPPGAGPGRRHPGPPALVPRPAPRPGARHA